MDDHDEELELMPRLQVFVKLGQEKKNEKGASSQERERKHKRKMEHLKMMMTS
jgi:hypothetical protein